MFLRSSWGGSLNWHLYSSYRETFWGISPSIYNLGRDFYIDEKVNFALLDLDRDTDVEPVYFELDRNVQEESAKVELDRGAQIESSKVELDSNIQAGQVDQEIDRVTKIESTDFEPNSDVKAKLVNLLSEFQIFPTEYNTNVAVESSSQISDINTNVLTTPLKTQSETDKQFSNSSLSPFIDLSSPKFGAKRLFTPLLDLINESGFNSTPFQGIFSSSGFSDSLIENISILFDSSLLKSKPLRNLAGAFDKPGHLLAWNTLALDFATASPSGPTPVTRWIAYLNTSQWDAWAVFEDKAVGSIYNQDKQENFISLLDSFEISGKDLAGFKLLYKYSTNAVRKFLKHAVRQVAMDVSAFNVFSEIQSSLFIGGIPDVLVGTAEGLLSKNLANTAELLLVDNIADYD